MFVSCPGYQGQFDGLYRFRFQAFFFHFPSLHSKLLYTDSLNQIIVSVVYLYTMIYSYCRDKYWRYSSTNIQYPVINCRSARVKESPPTNSEALIKQPHKYFDQVMITVRSGDGGHGAVLSMPNEIKTSKSQGRHEKEKSKRKGSYKRDSDGSLILPMGGHGGDIVIYADDSKESLLEFHKKRRYCAKRGGNVDAMGALTSHLHDGFATSTLRIPVPVGL